MVGLGREREDDLTGAGLLDGASQILRSSEDGHERTVGAVLTRKRVGIQEADRAQPVAGLADEPLDEVLTDHAGTDDQGRRGEGLGPNRLPPD